MLREAIANTQEAEGRTSAEAAALSAHAIVEDKPAEALASASTATLPPSAPRREGEGASEGALASGYGEEGGGEEGGEEGEEGEEDEEDAGAEEEGEAAAAEAEGRPKDTRSERGRYGLRKRSASAACDALPEAAEALYSGAALPIPASANGSDWPGGRLALTGGDGGVESQGLLGETRTLLDEVDGLYRAELPGLSTVIDLPAGGRRDVLREIVFSSAYTATLLAGAAGDYDEEGAQLCGAITVQLHARERYAEILTCAVARPWRGLGVARLLVAWIERLAHSASLRFLLVAAGTDVLKFWHRLGYTDVVPDDVPAPWVDELHAKFEGSQVMHRALPQAQAAADGVRDAIGQLQQAATKRRRR